MTAEVANIGFSETDSRFLANLRSISILMIVLGHVGLGWIFKPWSEFIAVFVTIFFFISGAVSYHSYLRTNTVWVYYIKRIGGLYIPYLLLCFLCLLVYLFQQGTLPDFNFDKFLAWLEIRPHATTMPFEVGQVWFIHTLVIISIISPVFFFFILQKKNIIFWFAIKCIFLLSAVQLLYDIDNLLLFAGNNFYKPLVHMIFFATGAWYFSGTHKCSYKSNWYLYFSMIMVGVCVLMVKIFDLNIGYGYHTYAPDIYYILGSFAVISLFLYCKKWIVFLGRMSKLTEVLLNVLFTYTMPIFLLHSFAIYICERFFGLVHPQSGFVIYGIVKFTLVMIITLSLSYPFRFVSNFFVKILKQKFIPAA